MGSAEFVVIVCEFMTTSDPFKFTRGHLTHFSFLFNIKQIWLKAGLSACKCGGNQMTSPLKKKTVLLLPENSSNMPL